MLNNIITLSTFSFFLEFFLMSSGILLTIVCSVLKTKPIFKYKIQKPICNCISFIFVMGAFLIINELEVFTIYNQTNINPLLYVTTQNDFLGIFAKFLICIFASMFFYIIADFLQNQKLESDYLLILYFANVGLILLCVNNDLMSSYLAIELISLSSYLLASFKKESKYSVEAGLKYFVMGSISSAFFLFGCSLIYATSGTVFFIELHYLFDSGFKNKTEELAAYRETIMESLDSLIFCKVMSKSMEEMLNIDANIFLAKYFTLKFCSDTIIELKNSSNYQTQDFVFLKKIELFIELGHKIQLFKDIEESFFNNNTAISVPKVVESYIQEARKLQISNESVITELQEKKQKLYQDISFYNSVVIKTEDVEMAKGCAVEGIKKALEMESIVLKIEGLYTKGLADLEKLDRYIAYNNTHFFTPIELGILFILFSIFIKLALAPFHLWSLDVYEGSPSISTFFFAVMGKLSFFIFLIRFCYIAMPTFITEWQFYSVWIAIISLLISSIGGLKQRKLKTLLAYSSINHMSYAMLAFSMGSSFSLKILITYLIIYMLSGICIWFSILLLKLKKRKKKYSKELSDLSLLGKSNPALASSLSISFFSIAGLPPFVGFLVKVGVFLSLLKEDFYFFCVVSVLCSVVSTFYYIRIVKIMFFENTIVGKLYYPITTKKVWLLSFCTFLLIFLFVNPKLLFLFIYIIVELK